MSKSYTVQPGDTLSKIGVKTLGDSSRWPDIVKANPQLSSRKTASDGSPIIFTGDVLIIPGKDNDVKVESGKTESVVLDKNAPQDLGLKGNGKFFYRLYRLHACKVCKRN